MGGYRAPAQTSATLEQRRAVRLDCPAMNVDTYAI